GKSKLEQIRASMGLDSGSDSGADRQLTGGEGQSGSSAGSPAASSTGQAGAPGQADPEAPRDPDEATDQPTPEDLSGPTLPRDTREYIPARDAGDISCHGDHSPHAPCPAAARSRAGR